MTDTVDFGGYESNSITSANAPTMEHFYEMISMDVPVRDGDDYIGYTPEEEEEGDEPTPFEEFYQQPEQEEPTPLPVVDTSNPKDLADAVAKMDEGQRGFEVMKNTVLEKGVTPEQLGSMEAEWAANGQLSDASYQLLEQAGYPKDFVNNYIAGQNAVSQAYVNSFINSVGGEKAFEGVVNLLNQTAPHLLGTLDDAICNRDLNTANAIISLAGNLQNQAAQLAQVQQQQRYGQPAQRSLTERAVPVVTAPAPEGFGTKEEMVSAMSDKRYGRDKAYTEEVRKKVGYSQW